jgi:hypothetical protein
VAREPTTGDGVWHMLSLMANDGQAMLDELEPLAYGWTAPRPATSEEIRSFSERVWLGDQLSRWGGGFVHNPSGFLRLRVERNKAHLESVAPFVHLFDANVATALMALRASEVLDTLHSIPQEAEIRTVRVPGPEQEWRDREDRQTLGSNGGYLLIANYVSLCSDLRGAMELLSQGGRCREAT